MIHSSWISARVNVRMISEWQLRCESLLAGIAQYFETETQAQDKRPLVTFAGDVLNAFAAGKHAQRLLRRLILDLFSRNSVVQKASSPKSSPSKQARPPKLSI